MPSTVLTAVRTVGETEAHRSYRIYLPTHSPKTAKKKKKFKLDSVSFPSPLGSCHPTRSLLQQRSRPALARQIHREEQSWNMEAGHEKEGRGRLPGQKQARVQSQRQPEKGDMARGLFPTHFLSVVLDINHQLPHSQSTRNMSGLWPVGLSCAQPRTSTLRLPQDPCPDIPTPTQPSISHPATLQG